MNLNQFIKYNIVISIIHEYIQKEPATSNLHRFNFTLKLIVNREHLLGANSILLPTLYNI